MVDYAQLVKLYGAEDNPRPDAEKKYSPAECIGAKKTPVFGRPDEKYISTSHVERLNLTTRMHNRRFTGLTNAFSKKLENHCHSIALHFTYYNFCKIHQTTRTTPALEAGLIKKLWDVEDIVNLIGSERN